MKSIVEKLFNIQYFICLTTLSLLLSACVADTDDPPPIGVPQTTAADEPGPFKIARYKLTFTNKHGLYGANIYYPADDQGNPDDTAGPYPIMVFSPGIGAVKEFNTWVGDHLSTHGYIVMVFSVPVPFIKYYNEQKDGLITGLQVLINEGNNPNSPIYHMTDVSKQIIGGHSMGAMGSLVAASEISGLSAVVSIAPADLSVAELAGIDAPTQIQGSNADCVVRQTGALGSYDNLPQGITKQVLIINGGNHVGFNDEGSLAEIAGELLVDCKATIDVFDHQQRLSRRYMTAWLDYYVKGESAASDYLYGSQAQEDLNLRFLTISK